MERISIFNYEAFYLDFLEGNLNEEDTALLLEFLDKHPELVVDMDTLPELEQPQAVIDTSFRDGLKQPDLETDVITPLNVESFIIASVEQQLSKSKERELGGFLNAYPVWADAYQTYEKIKLAPDMSIVYGDKSELKHRRALVLGRSVALWPSVAVAAGIIGFILVYSLWLTDTDNSGTRTARGRDQEEQPAEQHSTDRSPSKVQMANTEEQQNDAANPEYGQQVSGGTKTPNPAGRERQPGKQQRQQIASLEKRKFELDETERQDGIVVLNYPVTNNSSTAANTAPKKNGSEYMAMNDMKNPIKPITRRLSELTDTDIDLRTAKATEDKRGGFYIKIGKLEVERKRGKP